MVADFVPELVLAVFQFLPLKSLFAARAVNKSWCTLVAVSDMTPERRALYNLYLTTITSPAFLASRAEVFAKLVPFNRIEYIADLEQPDGTLLPFEFRCWVLEWPEKAVFGWVWPGLDPPDDADLDGVNCIGNPVPDSPPASLEPLVFFYPAGASPHPPETEEIKALYWDDELLADYEELMDPGDEIAVSRGLQITYHGCTDYTWLIVDNHKPLLHGTLHCIDGFVSHRETGQVAVGWVAWLGTVLDENDRHYLR